MANEHEVARVIFQVIEDGDRRKFEAVSNDADTGGGARDLRFRPANRFLPVLGRHQHAPNLRSGFCRGVPQRLNLVVRHPGSPFLMTRQVSGSHR